MELLDTLLDATEGARKLSKDLQQQQPAQQQIQQQKWQQQQIQNQMLHNASSSQMSPSHQLSTVGSSVARNLKRPYPSGSEPDSPLTGVSNSPSLPPTEQAWRYLTGMVPNQINLQKHQNQSAAAQQTQILPRFASPRPICQKIEESRSTTKLLQKQASRAPFIAPKHLPSDYQMQLILLEQQNKKRLMMKRQEQKDQSVGSPLSRTSETMHTNGAVSKTTNPPTWVVRTAPEDSQPSSTYIPPSENLEMVQVNQQRLFELFAQFLNEAGQKSNEAPEVASNATIEMLSSDGQETSDEPQPKRCRINALEQKHAGFSEGTETTALQSAGTCDTEQTLDEIVPVEHSRCHEESDNIESSDGESNPPIQLCKHCSQGTQVAQLYETIERLQGENEMLQALNMPEYVPPLPPRIQVFHRVRCECDQEERFGQVRITTYLDPPHRMTSDRRWHLQGHLNAPEESVYLDQNKDIVLLVYKNYRCKADAARYQWQGKIQKNPAITATEATPPTSSQESMMINSEVLREALIWASSESQTPGRIQEIRLRDEIKAPYHYLYHDRTYLAQKIRRMDEEHQIHVGLLVTYVEASFEASLKEASALFSQGLVNNETIPYLFEPKMYVVAQDAGELLAYEAECWLKEYRDKEEPEDCWSLRCWSLRCWSFKFDGSLIKSSRNFRFGWPGSRREVIPIQNLAVYPLRYGSPNLEQELYARGEKFWSCTNRIYVSYDDENIFGDPVQRGARYMVDIIMHKQLNLNAYPQSEEREERIPLSSLSKTEKPCPGFFLLLPSKVMGFSMQTKRWVCLKAACISPVVWNMQAFDSLVVDDDTKELVKALVTNQLAREKATDLMDGKGNGLVILLHGGPGTGKTLTAESVAELAHKPLYRVSCGDIGTNADAIDKHLQRVLHLGRLWECVVLLDEADVFLEERSLADMQRNALVSIFLRVLEYYDGILILTSNRVGTFDEAFKSRIQLALHYGNLTRIQRRAIWANFINRLEDIEKENVDTINLRQYLDELAVHDMNGRQIRNALTTARQLAKYKGRKMDYGLLRHAIGVAGKFDSYLKSVKHNISDDEIAREGGVR